MENSTRNRGLGYLSALLLMSYAGFAGGQPAPLPINLDADSSDFDRATNTLVFRGLRISQGALGIEADVAKASNLDFKDSRWEFTGNVRISMDGARIESENAELRFLEHELTEARIWGGPATFEQQRQPDSLTRGRAGEMQYDFASGIIRMSEHAWLSEGAREVTANSLIYNLAEKRIEAESQPDGEPVKITIVPKANGDSSGSQQPPPEQ